MDLDFWDDAVQIEYLCQANFYVHKYLEMYIL